MGAVFIIVTATDIKNNFGVYLKHVTSENGEVIITKNNMRVARLVPYISDIEKYFTVRENAAEYDYDRKTVSYEEFMEIYSKSNLRMEFINGEIFIMESPSLYHQDVLGELYVIFKNYFKSKKCKPYLAPFDVHFRKKDITDPDVMQPDMIVLCDIDNNVNARGRYMGTPSLTLEILSPGSRSKDMVYKLNTFMLSGVGEYWLVDMGSKMVYKYVFSDLQIDSMYPYNKDDIVDSTIFAGLEVRLADIFFNIPNSILT